MKIITLFTYCIFSFSLAHAIGFDYNTTITTSNGKIKPIRKLRVGDEVICYNEHLQPQSSTVKGIFEITTDAGIQIITEEDVIIHTSNTEQFFLPQKKLWVCAQHLKDGDYLLNINLEEIRITQVTQQYGDRKFFVIAIDTYHNFLASNGQYLVHNGPLAAWQAYWATKVGLYALLGGAVAATAAAGGTAAIAAHAAYAGGAALASTAVLAPAITTVGGTVVPLIAAAGTGTGTGIAVGAAISTAAIIGGADAAVTTGIVCAGLTSIASVSSAGAATTVAGAGAIGICAATAAAIESASVAAFMAALVCPLTPW